MNLFKITILFCCCYFGIHNSTFCQEKIFFKNPSFEAIRGNYGTLPEYWDDCSDGFEYSSSDLHSQSSRLFGVYMDPIDGETCVGMVTRADGSYESIGQFLEIPLQAATTYQFGVFLTRSKRYLSHSKVTRKQENFNEPIILRIWGGNYNGERKELLAQTAAIEHNDWQEYIFEFQPTETFKFLTFEAYFDENRTFPYRGNILIDNCSDIMIINPKPLSEIEDFSSLTNRKLFNLILECKEADINLKDLSTLDIIFDSWHFNNKLQEVGVVELTTLLTPSLLNHYLEVYRILELEEALTILTKTIEITKKKNKRLSELRFLKHCDSDYKAALSRADLLEKHLNFIKENQIEVVTLLEACQEK